MSKKSKDFIVKSLLKLLQTDEFDVITISEICDNTQIVRKTFYNNFSSKEDVMAYYSKNLIEKYYKKIKTQNSNNTQDAALCFFDFGIEHKMELKIIIKNHQFHIFCKEFKDKLPAINKLFSKNKVENILKEESKYLSSFMATGVLQVLEDWIISNRYKTAEDLTSLYFYMISNILKGYQIDKFEHTK